MPLSEQEKKLRLLQIVASHEIAKLRLSANPGDTTLTAMKEILDVERPNAETLYGYTATLTFT